MRTPAIRPLQDCNAVATASKTEFRSFNDPRTKAERVLKDTTGAGTTGADDEYAKEYFENVGAEIMGAGMFALHNFADDPNWRGWWGDEPPFGSPVFVLTQSYGPP